MRIRIQQLCQPEATSPPSRLARAACSSMHRLRIVFGGERDDLVAGDEPRSAIDDLARTEVVPMDMRHGDLHKRRSEKFPRRRSQRGQSGGGWLAGSAGAQPVNPTLTSIEELD
jgi:hypothetical protein